jgi:hypothetical protein
MQMEHAMITGVLIFGGGSEKSKSSSDHPPLTGLDLVALDVWILCAWSASLWNFIGNLGKDRKAAFEDDEEGGEGEETGVGWGGEIECKEDEVGADANEEEGLKGSTSCSKPKDLDSILDSSVMEVFEGVLAVRKEGM